MSTRLPSVLFMPPFFTATNSSACRSSRTDFLAMVGELAYFIGLLGDSLSVDDIIGFLEGSYIFLKLWSESCDDNALGDRSVEPVVSGEEDSTILL